MICFAFACLLSVPAQDPAAHHLFTFDGDTPDGRFGSAVGAAGDVNGDGFADLVVGAPHADGVGFSSGLARVLSGADGTELFAFEGDSPSDWLGFSVDGAGDVDGDGFADLVVGSPLGTPQAGSAKVFSGRDGTLLYAWSGDAPGDRFGNAVSRAGDVNGDGFADVLVGAPYADSTGLNAGCARVYSGVDGSVLRALAGSAGDFFGSAVSAAGDANSDGFADFLVGVPFSDVGAFNAGSACVFSGVGDAVLHAFHGSGIGDQLGNDVGEAGDVDGDGLNDFLLGVPGADAAGIDSGAAEVRAGSDGSVLLLVPGSSSGEYLGAVAAAGDVDGDGRDDVAVGAASSDAGGNEAGTVRIVSGASGLDLAAFHGEATFDWFGAALARLGDANGDGRTDLAVGAPGHDDVPAKKGYARILSTTDLALASDVHAVSLSAGGTQTLTLTTPLSLAGLAYVVLGSGAGTTPGIPIDSVVLPLAFEPVYFVFTLLHPMGGVLGSSGTGKVAVTVPAGSSTSLAGLVLHHAYLVVDPGGTAVFASNATPLLLQ